MADTADSAVDRTPGSTGDPRLDGEGWRGSPDDATVEAVGAVTGALETVEVTRGHLYALHQLTGAADKLGSAVELLGNAGHTDVAERLARELPGRWTFQVVEETRTPTTRRFTSTRFGHRPAACPTSTGHG
jgi:hypothetical protein